MKRCHSDTGFRPIMSETCEGLGVALYGVEFAAASSILSALVILNIAYAEAKDDTALPERLAAILHENTTADEHAWCGLYHLLGIIQDLRGERKPMPSSPSTPNDGGGILRS